MSAILFDLDGVLYEDNKVIEGAAETVNWFIQNGIPHLFLTNTTSKSRQQLVNKLNNFGIESTIKDFLTPPVTATQWLKHNKLNKLALYVPQSTKQEFSSFNLKNEDNAEVDAVIIGDLGKQWNFETMNRIFRQLMNNSEAQLIALGMTRYWRTGDGLQLDVGPMIKAFEFATGKSAIVCGKPDATFFQAAISLLGTKENVVMIGDDIHGDIEGAQQAGLKAILVRTGKFTSQDLKTTIKPETVLDSVSQLPEWWQSNM